MVRILHITPGLMIGGGQRVAVDIARTTNLLGHVEAAICVLGPRNDCFPEEYTSYIQYTGPYNDVNAMCMATWQLRSLIRRLRPRLVHTHAWEVDLMCGPALVGTDVAHVAHIHDVRHWVESNRVRHAVTRTITRVSQRLSAARYIAVSQCVKAIHQSRLKWRDDQIAVVHNGVDVEKFAPLTDQSVRRQPRSGGPTVGAAGRLVPGKGIDVLLRSWPRVLERHPTARLKIAGGGDGEGGLRSLVTELGILDSVEFVGFERDMVSFYNALDVFAFPSLELEGMPMTVLEAMATGTPVVATRGGATTEQIPSKDYGLLIPPNSAEALSDALTYLIDRPLVREQMGRHARALAVRNFSLGSMVAGVMSVYGSLKIGRT